MGFETKPVIGGEMYEMASRFATEAGEELAAIAEAHAQAACIGRHWAGIAELGWMATAIPETEGGAGGDLADLASLAAGAGRAALALPVAASCGVVPVLLAGHPILADVASGKARVAAILPGAARDADGKALSAAKALDGDAVGVETPPDPTHVALAIGGDEAVLLLVPTGAAGLQTATYLRIDWRLAADFHFGHVAIQPEWIVARGAQAMRRAEAARDVGALLTGVECVSAMGALVEQTIHYLLNRVQFGQPLATYQALRHRVAEMYVEYETLRGIVSRALRAAQSGEEASQAISFAKLRLGEAGRAVAESAIQCHGGMGMTEELPANRLCKRLMMAEFEFGNRVFHATRLLAGQEA
ncbi:acyl-CoA dehydrogenase family protein [Roseococcus sp. SYP-B2431]|uniref:acyl-CoA dehydrogenase family protein n=1 Tax=Roseococcus sp. SYP-B2431 TaxID=2496640 RepID=UPI0013F46E52|nr:acyl-CoA dehydrogenase family protein [Roseococcus sp. SYP-B2431]